MEILKAARLNLIFTPFILIISALSSILIIRNLSPAIYADYATLMSFLSLFVLFSEFGCNVGFARFLSEAKKLNARYTVYINLQIRRWVIAFLFALVLMLIGPYWAIKVKLLNSDWTPSTFFLIALLGAIMLHTQLASSAMLNSFKHGYVAIISQAVMFARALTLVILAIFIKQPIIILVVLIPIALVEAVFLHRQAVSGFIDERSNISSKFLNKAQFHGLVAVFDKLTTAFTGGPFLIIVLAGVYSRIDLAYLAAITELLQKILGVVSLPISNLVLPILNNSYRDKAKYILNIEIVGGLSILFFSFLAGGIATCLPNGIPLVLGAEYSDTVGLAIIWFFPLFIEAVVRMVWGAGLLTLADYKWLNKYNFFYALFSLLIIFNGRNIFTISYLMSLLGLLRIFMAIIILYKAKSVGLLNRSSFPIVIPLVCFFSAFTSVAVQIFLVEQSHFYEIFLGLILYLLIVAFAFRFFSMIPESSYKALIKLLGKHKKYLFFIIPLYRKS